LHTSDIRQAVKLSREYSYLIMADKKEASRIEEFEAEIERHDDMMAVGLKILKEYEETQKFGTHYQKTDFWTIHSRHEYECYRYAVDKIEKEQREEELKQEKNTRKHAKILSDAIKASGHSTKVVAGKQEAIAEESSITIDDLVKKFIEHKTKTKKWKDRTIVGNSQMLYVIKEFLEYAIDIKNPMIHLFKTEHAIKFEDEFCKYPRNCKKIFPDKSLNEIMRSIDNTEFAETERISTNTYNEYAILLMALFKWAKEDKKGKYLKGENVFIELKKTATASKSYSPFFDDELRLFFNSEMFAKKRFLIKFSWRYWVPIIMLYHGMRVEEVSQLLLKNIAEINSVWCFDIRDELDKEGKILTTTKIKGQNTGQRFVPIHPKVIEIGLLRYMDYLTRSGEHKLFPSLSNQNKKGEYKSSGGAVSKWFNEDSPKENKVSYFSSVRIEKEKRNLVLYSFKHTVETLLINHPEKIEHDKIDTVIGHTVTSMGRKHYGTYAEETLLADVVEKVDYPGADLPWDVNEGYNEIPFPWE